MESERMDEVDALRTVEAVRGRAAARQKPLDWIGVWWAVFLGGYVTLFTSAFGAEELPIEVLNAIALPPIIIAGALLEGARVRTGIRRQERAGFYIGLAVACLLMLAAIGVAVLGQPSAWLPFVFGPAVAVVMGAVPASRLLRTAGFRADWGADGLSRIGAVATLALAVLFGLAAAVGSSGGSLVTAILMAVVLLIAFASLIASSSRWGLEAIGASWSRRQWIGFALTVALLYGGALPVGAAGAHPLVMGLYGLAVAAPLALSAIPRRR